MNDSGEKLPNIPTWFDYLPFELIIEIFKYLSYNNVIHTFFYFNQRINHFLQQTNSLTYFELPTTTTTDEIFSPDMYSLLGPKIQAITMPTNIIS